MPKEKRLNHTPAHNESTVACLACRRAHKKCDRKLPNCARCSSKGWECDYGRVDRRFKPVEVMNQLNRTISSSDGNVVISNISNGTAGVNENWIQHSLNFETIRIYEDIVCLGVLCFARADYENMLKLSVKELNETRKDILALLLSVQCMCEHVFGFLPAAEQTALKSRSILRHVYEEFGNPFIASTYLNLASFYSVIGNVELARGYLVLVEHFSSKLQENSFEYQVMEKYNCKIGVFSLKIFSALVEINCSDSYPIPDIISLTKLYSAIPSSYYLNTDTSIEKRIEDMRMFALMAIGTGNSHRSELSTHVLQMCIKIFFNGLNMVKAIINGSKQSDISLEENTKLMEYHAYEIAKSCQDNTSILVAPYVTSFIVVATKLNFEIFKSIVKGDRLNNQQTIIIKENGSIEPSSETVDYYNVMKIGLNALKHLGDRYPYVSKIYSELDDFMQNNGNESMANGSGNTNFDNDIQHFLELLYEDPSNIYHEMKKFIDHLKSSSSSIGN